jgi:tetratricopeptide (TPR) repeat protein
VPFDREGTLRKAEKLIRQGRLDLAILEYRAVVEDQPTDWNTSNTLGDLYFRSGDVEKAVEQYCRIADHLADEGFLSKAAALYRKILKIKADDERAMWQLGNVAARQGLLVDARLNFQTLADRRRARHDRRGEAEVRVRLGELDGADPDARIAGAHARAELGDPGKAVEQLKEFAAALQEKGKDADALRLLSEVAIIDPHDAGVRDLLVKGHSARGDFEAATRVAQDDESGRAEVPPAPAAAGSESGQLWGLAEAAARAASEAEDWETAAATLNEFVARVPDHVPALMCLVEICIEGGLDAAMHNAQAQLADAYLAQGAGLEARIIAEDLVAREPWEQANLDRFRQALTLLGEENVDAIIAERLGGESPFTSTNAGWPAPSAVTDAPREASEVETATPPEDLLPRDAVALLRNAHEPVEVELDDMLYDLGKPHQADAAVPVEDVLSGIREAAARDASPEMAEQHFKLAETFMEIGMKMEGIKALEVAARSPRHRFRASAMLAKAWLDSGDAARAIQWYGQAAEAAAPSPHAHYVVMYELASVLEAEGEGARALAVLLELQSEAGEYRDVADRLEQLKLQMGAT